MDSILNEYMNPLWIPMKSNQLYLEVPMRAKNRKYKQLKSCMQGEFLKNITTINMIQNPILYQQFLIKVAECKLYNNIEIKQLFHSTDVKNVNSIIVNNFDWTLSCRVKYGIGVSFSPDPSYANLQSNIKNGTKRAMIVADVIVGKFKKGHSSIYIPEIPYDTTVSSDGTVFVKYNDHEFYPKYVIYYETFPVIKSNGKRMIKH